MRREISSVYRLLLQSAFVVLSLHVVEQQIWYDFHFIMLQKWQESWLILNTLLECNFFLSKVFFLLFSASPKANNLKCESNNKPGREKTSKKGSKSESKQRSCNKVPRINYKQTKAKNKRRKSLFVNRAAIFVLALNRCQVRSEIAFVIALEWFAAVNDVTEHAQSSLSDQSNAIKANEIACKWKTFIADKRKSFDRGRIPRTLCHVNIEDNRLIGRIVCSAHFMTFYLRNCSIVCPR